jgi:hypothetical protein
MKPTIKEEKILKEGLEKASENQGNTRWMSCRAFWHPIGFPPWAGSRPADLVCLSKEDSLFLCAQSKVQDFSNIRKDAKIHI